LSDDHPEGFSCELHFKFWLLTHVLYLLQVLYFELVECEGKTELQDTLLAVDSQRKQLKELLKDLPIREANEEDVEMLEMNLDGVNDLIIEFSDILELYNI